MNHLATTGSRSSEKVTPASERALRDRIEELEEEVRQLRRENMDISFPPEWRLTAAHARLLRRLHGAPGGFLTHEKVYDALRLWADSAENEVNLVRSQICKMRQRLSPFGIEIRKRWGQGYELPPETKAKITGVLAERAIS